MPDFVSRQGCRLLLLALLLTSAAAVADNPRDPYEHWNRKVFVFNETLDAWVLKPVATGYRAVTPGFLRTGVRSFFSNLGEISNFANNLLQAKPAAAGKDVLRFSLNSTLGVLGLFDLATPLGLQKSEEDFGQTLNVWGVPQGPYLVLPFLGGQNLSHSLSLPVDYYLNPTYHIKNSVVSYSFNGLFLVQRRVDLLEVEKLIQGDRYSFIRDTYLQRRSFLLNDGKSVDDPFLDDEDFDFDDEDFAY